MNKDNYPVLVDKYIYKTYNDKYRLYIRSGDYYFSSMYNTLQEAKHVRKIKMSEKVLVNNKKNNATVNEFVNIWILIEFCIPEDISIIEKLEKIHNYIDNKYSFFKKININVVNISNIFDWLEEQKEMYGNEFIITHLI